MNSDIWDHRYWDQAGCFMGGLDYSSVPSFDPNKQTRCPLRAEVTSTIAWTLFPLGWWIYLGPGPSTCGTDLDVTVQYIFMKKSAFCHSHSDLFAKRQGEIVSTSRHSNSQVGEPNLAVLSCWRGQPSLLGWPWNMSMFNAKRTQQKCKQTDHEDFPWYSTIFQCHVWNLEARDLRTVEWQMIRRCRSMYPSARLGIWKSLSKQQHVMWEIWWNIMNYNYIYIYMLPVLFMSCLDSSPSSISCKDWCCSE